jgi:hypothetical protein
MMKANDKKQHYTKLIIMATRTEKMLPSASATAGLDSSSGAKPNRRIMAKIDLA